MSSQDEVEINPNPYDLGNPGTPDNSWAPRSVSPSSAPPPKNQSPQPPDNPNHPSHPSHTTHQEPLSTQSFSGRYPHTFTQLLSSSEHQLLSSPLHFSSYDPPPRPLAPQPLEDSESDFSEISEFYDAKEFQEGWGQEISTQPLSLLSQTPNGGAEVLLTTHPQLRPSAPQPLSPSAPKPELPLDLARLAPSPHHPISPIHPQPRDTPAPLLIDIPGLQLLETPAAEPSDPPSPQPHDTPVTQPLESPPSHNLDSLAPQTLDFTAPQLLASLDSRDQDTPRELLQSQDAEEPEGARGSTMSRAPGAEEIGDHGAEERGFDSEDVRLRDSGAKTLEDQGLEAEGAKGLEPENLGTEGTKDLRGSETSRPEGGEGLGLETKEAPKLLSPPTPQSPQHRSPSTTGSLPSGSESHALGLSAGFDAKGLGFGDDWHPGAEGAERLELRVESLGLGAEAKPSFPQSEADPHVQEARDDGGSEGAEGSEGDERVEGVVGVEGAEGATVGEVAALKQWVKGLEAEVLGHRLLIEELRGQLASLSDPRNLSLLIPQPLNSSAPHPADSNNSQPLDSSPPQPHSSTASLTVNPPESQHPISRLASQPLSSSAPQPHCSSAPQTLISSDTQDSNYITASQDPQPHCSSAPQLLIPDHEVTEELAEPQTLRPSDPQTLSSISIVADDEESVRDLATKSCKSEDPLSLPPQLEMSQTSGSSKLTTTLSVRTSRKQRQKLEKLGILPSSSDSGSASMSTVLGNQCIWCRKGNEGKRKLAALSKACSEGRLQMVQVLVEAKADVNKRSSKRSGAFTPLMYASRAGHSRVVRYLISENARIEDLDSENRTALFHGASRHHPEVVKVLVEAGALETQKELKDDWNDSIWSLWGMRTKIKDPLEAAVALKDPDVEFREEVVDLLCDTKLTAAAREGQFEKVKELLAAGISLEERNAFGSTALHQAAKEGHLELVEYLLEEIWVTSRKDSEARLFIEHRNHAGNTAMALAQKRSQDAVIEVMRNAGAHEMQELEIAADALKVWYTWYVKESLQSAQRSVLYNIYTGIKIWSVYSLVLIIALVQLCFTDSILRDSADDQNRKAAILFSRWLDNEGCSNNQQQSESWSLDIPVNIYPVLTAPECPVPLAKRLAFRMAADCQDFQHDWQDLWGHGCGFYAEHICKLSPSAPQPLNSSAPQPFNSSAPQPLNSSAPQPLNSSAPRPTILDYSHIFKVLDFDKSNTLSVIEVQGGANDRFKGMLRERHSEFDTDGNGLLSLEEFSSPKMLSNLCGIGSLESCGPCGAQVPEDVTGHVTNHKLYPQYIANRRYEAPHHDYSPNRGYFLRYNEETQTILGIPMPIMLLTQLSIELLILIFCFNQVAHSFEVDILTIVLKSQFGSCSVHRIAGWAAMLGSILSYRIVPLATLITSWILVLESEDIVETILNALALLFILDIDEFLQVFVPKKGSALMKIAVHKGWSHMDFWSGTATFVIILAFPMVAILTMGLPEVFQGLPAAELLNPYFEHIIQLTPLDKGTLWIFLVLIIETLRQVALFVSKPGSVDMSAILRIPCSCCWCCCKFSLPIDTNLVLGISISVFFALVYYSVEE